MLTRGRTEAVGSPEGRPERPSGGRGDPKGMERVGEWVSTWERKGPRIGRSRLRRAEGVALGGGRPWGLILGRPSRRKSGLGASREKAVP